HGLTPRTASRPRIGRALARRKAPHRSRRVPRSHEALYGGPGPALCVRCGARCVAGSGGAGADGGGGGGGRGRAGALGQGGAVAVVQDGDAFHVALRLVVGRDAAVAGDCAFAGVVGGGGQAHVAFETVEQPGQVGGATLDVLPGVER